MFNPLSTMRAYSKENAENVVKPPRNPVVTNSLSKLLGVQYEAISSIRTPIKKQPNILTKNIGAGKYVRKNVGKWRHKMVLKIAPKAPPMPTATITLNFIMYINLLSYCLYFHQILIIDFLREG